jgi:mono/diheme cytochrome c family protein
MSEPAPPPGNPRAGKLIAVALVVMVVGAMSALGAIGYYHATRNTRRHGERVLTGAELYAMYCQRCHAADGSGDRPYPALARPASQEAFATHVRAGKERMPAFAETFRPDELARLYEHVSGLPAVRGQGN